MSESILHSALDRFEKRLELSEADAEFFFDALIAETDERLLAAILTKWEVKGTTEDELYALASIMRKRCLKVNSTHETFVDAVGTGGSKAKTFNVSTAAAFVISGAGVPVAKHGNRAATSNSGSADVLEALGVNPSVDTKKAEECLNEIGICFMFAPNFHRLSPVLAKVRRGLGFPTIFNNLGPLCNPANAPHQTIGVWRHDLVEKTANVLARLGTRISWVVHGSDGLDEITLNGKTAVAMVENGRVRTLEISAEDFGVESSNLDHVRLSTSAESAALIGEILGGKCSNRSAIDLVATNAAAAIFVAGAAADLREAFKLAIASINCGAAFEKLEQLRKATRK